MKLMLLLILAQARACQPELCLTWLDPVRCVPMPPIRARFEACGGGKEESDPCDFLNRRDRVFGSCERWPRRDGAYLICVGEDE